MLVSQRDRPALQRVDLRSRSQSRWLVCHLPSPSLHTQKQFGHSPHPPDPSSCGRFMTSWLPHSLCIRLFSPFSRLRVFCMEMCSPFSAGLRSYLTGLTFFIYCITLFARTRGHRNLPVALLLLLSKLPLYYFYSSN